MTEQGFRGFLDRPVRAELQHSVDQSVPILLRQFVDGGDRVVAQSRQERADPLTDNAGPHVGIGQKAGVQLAGVPRDRPREFDCARDILKPASSFDESAGDVPERRSRPYSRDPLAHKGGAIVEVPADEMAAVLIGSNRATGTFRIRHRHADDFELGVSAKPQDRSHFVRNGRDVLTCCQKPRERAGDLHSGIPVERGQLVQIRGLDFADVALDGGEHVLGVQDKNVSGLIAVRSQQTRPQHPEIEAHRLEKHFPDIP